MDDIQVQGNQAASPNNVRNPTYGGTTPGFGVMGKTVTVARYYQATLWTWIGFFLLILTLILHIIAFAAPGWAHVSDFRGIGRDIGLWTTCRSDSGCYYHTFSELTGAFKASQAFAIFSLIGIFVSLVFFIAYIFYIKKYQDARFAVGAMISRIASAIFLLITWAVFCSRYADGKYDSPGYYRELNYCFGFEIMCFVFEIVGAVLLAGEISSIKRSIRG